MTAAAAVAVMTATRRTAATGTGGVTGTITGGATIHGARRRVTVIVTGIATERGGVIVTASGIATASGNATVTGNAIAHVVLTQVAQRPRRQHLVPMWMQHDTRG